MPSHQKNLLFFVLIPVGINLLLIGLYFSGIHFAQQIASPQLPQLPFLSGREFGLVEQLQNIFLLGIIAIFLRTLIQIRHIAEKIFFLLALIVMVFLFLEEIDYGLHFYEYFTGEKLDLPTKSRNWHNQDVAGKTNVTYLKKLIDLMTIIWFLFLPLLALKMKLGWLTKLVPPFWFFLGFIISIVFSNLAHYLQDMQFDVINGIHGNLQGNISEFRETTTYYLYLLYAIQLVAAKNIFSAESHQEGSVKNQ